MGNRLPQSCDVLHVWNDPSPRFTESARIHIRLLKAVIVVLLCVGRPCLGAGELASETIQLSAGWNMVWLNLDPEPNETAAVLEGVDFQSIWTFQPSSGAFASDASVAPGRWFRFDKDLPAPVNNLRFLRGQRGYLIRMNSSARLTVIGRPALRTREFKSHVSNLFGALTNPLALQRLTFERFFAHPKAQGKIQSSAAPSTPEIFALVNDVFVRRAATDEIREHGAYWVNMSQAFEYRGPIDVASDSEGLNFGRTAQTRTVTLEVPVSAQEEFLAIRAIPCAQIGGIPTCSGEDPSWLQFRDPTLPPSKASWSPLMSGVFLVIPPGSSSVSLEIRAQRDALATVAAAGTVASGAVSGVSLAAVIEISSDNGSRVLLPTGVEVQPIHGQWIGRATLTKVSTHPALQDLPLEEASAVPLGVTLILDLPDLALPAGATGFRLLDSVELPSHRDGESFMRRVHAILFDRPVVLAEDSIAPLDLFGNSGTLTGTIQTSAEDPLNPFRHRYNPEHRVGYDITRSITLQIQRQQDSVVDELSGLDGTFGPNKLTGIYTEIITGVSRDPITVSGSFRLQRLTEGTGGLTQGS